jgi:fructosamine-3-kinase
VRLTPLKGGCIASVYRADLPDGQAVVAKVAGQGGTLDIEAFMLRYLREHSGLPVPDVLHAEPGLLILSHVPGESRFSPAAEEHAADLLASLHGVTWTHFGLEWDTLIGSLPQRNTPTRSWIEFFRDHRLLAMARAAREAGRLGPRGEDRIRTLADRLDDLLVEPERPSLIHGDVWTTNVLAVGDRITAFLDPAISYADPEIELAFITLFSTFGRSFFDRYQQRRPIRAGFFETRRHLYNLYPLLVHARLFGGSYAADVERTVTGLGF